MNIVTGTRDFGRVFGAVGSWQATAARPHRYLVLGDGVPGPPQQPPCPVLLLPERLGTVGLLQVGFGHSTADVVAFLHDDVTLSECGWDERVEREFLDPSIGVVGFGGALACGPPDRSAGYRWEDMGRSFYASNTDDAERHGERLTGNRDVAVLDGFALICRRDVLVRVGGWPVGRLIHHGYDYWLCLTARRLGYRVRQVGVRCLHYGSTTTCRDDYEAWLHGRFGLNDAELHERARRFIWEEFPDDFPCRV